MNNEYTIIKELIEKKKANNTLTEKELNYVKIYVINTLLSVHDESVEIDMELQHFFPNEWGDAQDVINEY